MGGASNLINQQLRGQHTGRIWTATEQISVEPGMTKGQFSIGYKVSDEQGREAFVKASDMSLALSKEDPVKALLEVTSAHQFERSILEHCQGNRLDRVVIALDSGTLEVTSDGIRDIVFFIIFELADGDLRKFVEIEQGNDLNWVMSTLHSLSVAVSQIHSVQVYHNDLKPANALVFRDAQKVADFGRATSPAHPVAHDPLLCAGDRRFAPPEQLYYNENEATALEGFLKARAGDLYNLGSMMHYLITKRMLTPEILGRMDSAYKPLRSGQGWCDSYEAVLPYWRAAYDAVITEFYDDLPEIWLNRYRFALDEIRDVVTYLCDPDFRLRGDLSSGQVNHSKLSLERITSKLDNLKARVLVKSRAR